MQNINIQKSANIIKKMSKYVTLTIEICFTIYIFHNMQVIKFMKSAIFFCKFLKLIDCWDNEPQSI